MTPEQRNELLDRISNTITIKWSGWGEDDGTVVRQIAELIMKEIERA